jgi:hypothetical protein
MKSMRKEHGVLIFLEQSLQCWYLGVTIARYLEINIVQIRSLSQTKKEKLGVFFLNVEYQNPRWVDISDNSLQK